MFTFTCRGFALLGIEYVVSRLESWWCTYWKVSCARPRNELLACPSRSVSKKNSSFPQVEHSWKLNAFALCFLLSACCLVLRLSTIREMSVESLSTRLLSMFKSLNCQLSPMSYFELFTTAGFVTCHTFYTGRYDLAAAGFQWCVDAAGEKVKDNSTDERCGNA